MSRIIKRTNCPKCPSSDGFHLYDDGHGYCFVCKHYDKGTSNVSYESKPQAKQDITLYKSLPIRALTHKPISQKICERYGVRVSVNEIDGKIEKVYYPYYKVQDSRAPSSYKIKDVNTGEYVSHGDTGKVGLFGRHLYPAGGRLLIITEGEDDTLSLAEILDAHGKNYAVVSISDGANSKNEDTGKIPVSKTIFYNMEYIRSFETVIISFDNRCEYAPLDPGPDYAKAVADEIVGEGTQVKIMTLPLKDIGDMLKAGRQDEVFSFGKFKGLHDHSPELIVRGSEISLEQLRTPKKPGLEIPYPELQRKLHGIRKGEVTLFCAGSGIGKSTLVKEIAYHLVKEHNQVVANIFLETPMDDAARGYIAIDNNVSAAKLSYNPNIISEEAYEASFKRFIGSDRLHFFNHFGSLVADKLVNKMNYFVKVLGVDFIVLDHLSMVVSGSESDNERKDLDVLMTNLVKLVVETGVGVIAVVHLKRVPGKNYNTGAEVELTDLRGSAGLEQMSWSVIGLERDQQGESKDFSRIRVLKNRTHGFTGLCDTLKFDHNTGRLLPVQVEEY